eukprot:Opistho-2@2263
MQTSLLKGHSGCVNTVAWNESGELLLTGSDDHRLNVYNVRNEKLIHSVETGHVANIFAAKFVPATNDTQMLSCAADGTIVHSDVNTDSHKKFRCHTDMAYELYVVPSEPGVFLSCSADHTVKQFDLRVKSSCMCHGCTEDTLVDLEAVTRSPSPTSMNLNPVDHNYFAVGCSDSRVRVYDRRFVRYAGAPACEFVPDHLAGRRSRITSVRYDPDTGSQLLVSYSGECIYLFDLSRQGQRVTAWPGAEAPEQPGRRRLRVRTALNDDETTINNPLVAQLEAFINRHVYADDDSDDGDDSNGGDDDSDTASSSGEAMDIDPLDDAVASSHDNSSDGSDGAVVSEEMAPERHPFAARGRNPPPLRQYPEGPSVTAEAAPSQRATDTPASHVRARRLRSPPDVEPGDRLAAAVRSRRAGNDDVATDDTTESAPLQLVTSLAGSALDSGLVSVVVSPPDDRNARVDDGDAQRRDDAARRIQRGFRNMKRGRREEADCEAKQSEFAPALTMRYLGHRNVQTMIKQVGFFGTRFVMSGSDDGRLFFWEKATGKLLHYVEADRRIVNCCVQHPFDPIVAASGIDSTIKIFGPSPDVQTPAVHLDDVVNRNESRLREDGDHVSIPASLVYRMLLSMRSAAPRAQESDAEG